MSTFLRNLNYAAPWRGYMKVWGADIYHPSLDRWLYLFLHKLGKMGALERRVIKAHVHPGMSVLDVGGNIGLYTALFSQCVGPEGKVTTLEPVRELHQALLRTIERNHFNNIELHACAAGSSEGSIDLSLDSFNSGNNWIAKNSQNADVVPVPVCRIDNLKLERRPDFIKIDVQGWESEALRGMSGLLGSFPQSMIFCEISETALRTAGSSTRELGQILLDHGYNIKLFSIKNGELDSVSLNLQSLERKALSTLYFDVLAVPSSAALT